MIKETNIIDLFVTIVDNYGDMGFTCELIMALRYEYGDEFECIVWTDDVAALAKFVEKSQIPSMRIADIGDFGQSGKSTRAISVLHAPIPSLDLFESRALILRVDYLSLDPEWVSVNETEHITSTPDRQIIEIIPSLLENGAGLVHPSYLSQSEDSSTSQSSEHRLLRTSQGQNPSIGYTDLEIDLPCVTQGKKTQKHIMVFVYASTLERIDWDSFPDDLTVYVFGTVITKKTHIISIDWLALREFYIFLDTSEFVIIRGEVSSVHTFQTEVPFFWDMYQDIGGFPSDQSEQFLSIIDAPFEYREVHQILNGQKPGKIKYADLIIALYHTQFVRPRTKNLIHTLKKHLDRFNNSI